MIGRFKNELISPEDLKDKFMDFHCYAWEDRRSLNKYECLRLYFPRTPITPVTKEDKLELKKAKRIIREAIKLCEKDPDCDVGNFFKPSEWRICKVDEEVLKWKIVKYIWGIIKGWKRKEDDHRTKYSVTITEEDLIAFEKELEQEQRASGQSEA